MGVVSSLVPCLAQTPAVQRAKLDFEAVPFREFLAGFSSPVSEPRQWVITSQTEFQSYWSDTLGHDPKDTPKVVDFRRNALVAIHIGPRATSGYNVYVQSVVKISADSALITYVEQKPRPLTVVVQGRTSPWVLLKVPASYTSFSFKQNVKTIKYPPVRDDPQQHRDDPDTVSHATG